MKLWAASLASLVLGGAVAALPVAEHVSGTAVVVPAARLEGEGAQGLRLVAFFTPEARARLAAGQRLLVDVRGPGPHVEGQLRQVEPAVLSPEAAVERFGLKGPTRGLEGPSAWAVAVFEPPASGPSAQDWLGSTFRVEVEVGQRRLLSSLPLFSRLHEG